MSYFHILAASDSVRATVLGFRVVLADETIGVEIAAIGTTTATRTFTTRTRTTAVGTGLTACFLKAAIIAETATDSCGGVTISA